MQHWYTISTWKKTQSVLIKLASPPAAQLSIILEENQSCCTSYKDLNWGRTTEKIEKRKSPAPGGIWTHDLSVARRALYHCARTAAHKKNIAFTGSFSFEWRFSLKITFFLNLRQWKEKTKKEKHLIQKQFQFPVWNKRDFRISIRIWMEIFFWMKSFGAFEMKNWIGWFCLTETSHSDSIMMQQMKRIVQEWMNAWMDEWMNFKEWVP